MRRVYRLWSKHAVASEPDHLVGHDPTAESRMKERLRGIQILKWEKSLVHGTGMQVTSLDNETEQIQCFPSKEINIVLVVVFSFSYSAL